MDTENLRLRFNDMFGQPDKTYVVGASEGGIITAETTELFGVGEDGSLNYDGSLPMCGPLAGGRRNFYGAFDLRVIYQYYCQNLPRPDEPHYPLWLGLAPGDPMTPDELGFLGMVMAHDQPASSAQTQTALGWRPAQPARRPPMSARRSPRRSNRARPQSRRRPTFRTTQPRDPI